MSQFPKMLFKFPGVSRDAAKLQDGVYETLIVGSDEHDQALSDGWSESPADARAVAAKAEDNAPPTRAELEAKATELGLKFDGRTTDQKLAALIAAKV